jgi:hypothetical protein
MHDSLLNSRWIRSPWTRSLMQRRSSSRSINVSNVASDENSVFVSKLIIEFYTSIMPISEWRLNKEIKKQRNKETKKQKNKGTTSTAEQLYTILSIINRFIRTIRTIRTIGDGG